MYFYWANPGLCLVYYISFEHKFYGKIVDFSGIRTRIVRVEGTHADHLTNVTSILLP